MFIVHYVIIGTWEENKLEKWKIVELKSKRLQGDGSCAKGLRRKVWTRTKNLSPNIRYFVALLRFVAIYVLFRTRKKCFFWSKKVLLGQEVHYYMEYIAYYADKNLQICNYAKKRRICHENKKKRARQNFVWPFCSRRKAANFCHPAEDNTCKPKLCDLCFIMWYIRLCGLSCCIVISNWLEISHFHSLFWFFYSSSSLPFLGAS